MKIDIQLLIYFLGTMGAIIAIAWRFGNRIGTIESSVNWIKDSFQGLQSSICTHGEDIAGLKVHTKYGISRSPTVPNDEGNRLLRDSGFLELYPKIRNKVFALMDTMGLRTLYDYEKGAYSALEALKNDPDIDPLKNHAVSHPDESLELIFAIASWIIRDEYNEEKAKRVKT